VSGIDPRLGAHAAGSEGPVRPAPPTAAEPPLPADPESPVGQPPPGAAPPPSYAPPPPLYVPPPPLYGALSGAPAAPPVAVAASARPAPYALAPTLPAPVPNPLAPTLPPPVPIPGSEVSAGPAPARARIAEVSESNRWRRPQLRTSLTILLFAIGIAAGVAVTQLARPSARPPATIADSVPSLSRVAEPIQSSAVMQALAANDVHALAQVLDSDTLTAIQMQLKPLVTYENEAFSGATVLEHDTLAAYIVRGRDSSGTTEIVGIVIRIRDGKVVSQ
jgi:hypothetical protein